VAKSLTAQRYRSETEKNVSGDLFGSQFKKYHPSGNVKFNYLGISQSFELRTLKDKTLSISLKLNVTPNTLSCSRLI